jgi:hypothetical protein
MAELVVMPDSAAVATTFLTAQLAGIHVGTVIPKIRPASFVLVRRLGGVQRNRVVDEALLGVECWAATDAAAHDLAQQCRALLHSLEGSYVGSVWVYRITEAGGPSDLPDPLSDVPRYVFSLAIAVRGAAVAS